MRKISLKRLSRVLWSLSFAGLSVSMITACSAIEQHAPSASTDAALASPVAVPQVTPAKLSADQVYRVLAAEALYMRGETASAAQVYLDLAQRYEDAGLAQRAYELSASSGNAQLLGQASQLNTQMNPNQIESWQV
ncbi:MAG: hypothetical protein KAZ85_02965, partial [Gammaproteobacteria bacterium]|nr:hypothetical protein [Gammaproteobacteria bacterium]